MKIFLSFIILFNFNIAYSDHHHDHDHHDDHDDHSEERREGAVHVHGYNQVDLITNDNIMKITYTMPIVQLNDQHSKNDDDHDHDHHEDEKAPDLSNFKNHNLVFETSKNAKCKLTNYDSKIIEDKNDKNHKDVILDYTFNCKVINDLNFINFTAFKTFNDLEKINFKGIVNSKAFANLLTKDKYRINFK